MAAVVSAGRRCGPARRRVGRAKHLDQQGVTGCGVGRMLCRTVPAGASRQGTQLHLTTEPHALYRALLWKLHSFTGQKRKGQVRVISMTTEHLPHCVIETQTFVNAAAEVGLDEDDRRKIVLFLSDNPTAGDLITGTGGARKLRFAFRGRGKSGGVRVITYFAAEDIPVFLLDVYDKTVKINLTQAERNALKVNLATMADQYRETNQQKIRDLKRVEN